jgi:hypothetical protein
MRLKLSLSLNQDHVLDIYIGKDIRITCNPYQSDQTEHRLSVYKSCGLIEKCS